MLHELDALPRGFLEARHHELYELLQRPTLIHLKGENPQPLFVCTLLHGNEDTGLYSIQKLLERYQGRKLPRSLSIFIGNVEASAQNLRRLEHQADYNRTWPGTAHPDSDETRLMRQVTDIMRKRQPFASIDIHNNTGRNPHYACVNSLEPSYLQLARMFSRTVVYFLNPKGVQSAAFEPFCPAVTLECGKIGEIDGIEHATNYLDTCLQLEHLPDHAPREIDLFHTVIRVTIPEQYTFSFEAGPDLHLNPVVESYNFREMEQGTVIARRHPGSDARLEAWNDDGEEVADKYFKFEGDEIHLRQPMMPSMFTQDLRAIKLDCLCYLMERLTV